MTPSTGDGAGRLRVVEAILRGEGPFAVDSRRRSIGALATAFVVGGLLYGLALGAFGGRPLQMLYSGMKVPLLLVVVTLIGLPNFFVLNAVLGLGRDFGKALKAVVAAQATFAIVLASLGPVTLVFYQSTLDYRLALNFNGLPFALALVGGQVTLSRHYRPLIARNPRHRVPLWTWLFLYALVAMQMAWVLRPFVGDPGLAPEFLRDNAWSNAYVEIWADVVRLAGGR